ncbi:hypothetical protein, conserved [Eimeria brunetti]|uniref:Uncharacterized protein n=1 Tax=Eimeria brunetti TaxID=51314 RepID=U6LGK9_9EIME|nr:hypothetical protein, conserved [Eimeria brunetti]
MPRAPFAPPTELLSYGHSLPMRDSADSRTDTQPASSPPVCLIGYGKINHIMGSRVDSDAPNVGSCFATPNGSSGCRRLQELNSRQKDPKLSQSLPGASALQTDLARLSHPGNNQAEQPAANMGASMSRCGIPVAVPWEPLNIFNPSLPSLKIPPFGDKFPSLTAAASLGYKRPFSAVSTEKMQIKAQEATSGPPYTNKVGLNSKLPVSLQSLYSYRDESNEMSTVTTTQPGKSVPERGLQVMASTHAKRGNTVQRRPRPRLNTSVQGEQVAAKMYFHPSKMAWRSELLVDGCKRQRSFSCKLYGYERAKMMCEWSRNFVLRTARVPTEDETRDAIGQLLGSRVEMTDTDESPSLYTGWLYANPPFETGPACSPGVENEPDPAEKQKTYSDNYHSGEHRDQHTSLKCGSRVFLNPKQHLLRPVTNASAYPFGTRVKRLHYSRKNVPAMKSIEEMEEQHLLARTFLRRVIEKNKQVCDSDVLEERVEKLSELAEAPATKKADSEKPSRKESRYRPRIPCLSQRGPPVTKNPFSVPPLLSRIKHSHLEHSAAKSLSLPQAGVQPPNISVSAHYTCSDDSNDLQAHAYTKKPLTCNTKGLAAGFSPLGCPHSRTKAYKASYEAPQCPPPPAVELPGQSDTRQLSPSHIKQAQGNATLSETVSDCAPSIRIGLPNSALVFSGDDPQDIGCLQSAAQ